MSAPDGVPGGSPGRVPGPAGSRPAGDRSIAKPPDAREGESAGLKDEQTLGDEPGLGPGEAPVDAEKAGHGGPAPASAPPEGAGGIAHRLETGILWLDTDPPAEPALGPLFEIAERQNPRRAFLFVSTLLGRHIPVPAARHAAALGALGARVASALAPGTVLVMSYAETAVGLGAGVARALRQSDPEREILFLPTTRHAVAGRTWFGFSEDHSHAAEHLVLRPAPHPALGGGTLVLVDDETTTGRTFAALAGALAGQGLAFSRIVLATLTDWSSGAAAEAVRAASQGAAHEARPDVRTVSLVAGRWHWRPDPGVALPALPGARAPACPPWAPGPDGPFAAPRLGRAQEAPLPFETLLARGLPGPVRGRRTLVIGSGEHVWAAFLLAEALASHGEEASFLATTRSPIRPGATIRRKLAFPDHFGLGIEMYLHNVDPAEWDRLILMTETGPEGIPRELLSALGPLHLIDGAGQVHAPGAP